MRETAAGNDQRRVVRLDMAGLDPTSGDVQVGRDTAGRPVAVLFGPEARRQARDAAGGVRPVRWRMERTRGETRVVVDRVAGSTGPATRSDPSSAVCPRHGRPVWDSGECVACFVGRLAPGAGVR